MYGMKIVERKHSEVVRTNIEIMASINDRMIKFCQATGWSKRRLMETAVSCFLNERDMQLTKKDGE